MRSFFLLTGAPGSGKTRLIEQLGVQDLTLGYDQFRALFSVAFPCADEVGGAGSTEISETLRITAQTENDVVTATHNALKARFRAGSTVFFDITAMVAIYTRPAASTKRKENRSTGGLGIGAKSPHIVTDRFTVVGTRDGVTATLIMARINGQLMHSVREITETPDEPDGVTVTVPVEPTEENILAWHKALSRVHFWWDAGLVEVTNAAEITVPLPTWQERLLAADDIAPVELPDIIIGKQVRTSMVLMGQIAYQIPADVAPSRHPTIYRLPVGAVSIAPTRESIVANAENQAVLRKVLLTRLQALFAGAAAAMADPTTSLWTLRLIRAEIHTRGLADHFLEWCRLARTNLVEADRLPGDKYRLQRLFDYCFPWDGLKVSPKYSAHVYGTPDGGAARAVPFTEILDGASARKVVFVDNSTLPERKRKILTRWAREEGVLAVTIERSRLESIMATPNFSWSRKNVPLTRPFADPGQLTWIDPADISVERAPKKPVAPVGVHTSVEVHQLRGRRVTIHSTVGEVITRMKGKRNRWAIIDTQRALADLPSHLPEHVLTLPSGQQAAKLIREQLGEQVLTTAVFMTKQAEIVVASLTPTQRRWVADVELVRRGHGLQRFFHHHTEWIEQIEEPPIKAVAQEIAAIVAQAATYGQLRHDASKQDRINALGLNYGEALRTLTQDESWLLENGSLGKYAPVLLAAASDGFLSRYARESNRGIQALVRLTIASLN